VKRARCLEDAAAEADDFKAFLEDRTFDFTLADEESPMWCPWLPLASPPTPPLRPKASAFVTHAEGNRVVSERNALRSGLTMATALTGTISEIHGSSQVTRVQKQKQISLLSPEAKKCMWQPAGQVLHRSCKIILYQRRAFASFYSQVAECMP